MIDQQVRIFLNVDHPEKDQKNIIFLNDLHIFGSRFIYSSPSNRQQNDYSKVDQV